MIDLTTLAKLKNADKALTKARQQMVKLFDRKRINYQKLYEQVQVGWSTVEDILNDVDPAYMKRKRDRSRQRQKERRYK